MRRDAIAPAEYVATNWDRGRTSLLLLTDLELSVQLGCQHAPRQLARCGALSHRRLQGVSVAMAFLAHYDEFVLRESLERARRCALLHATAAPATPAAAAPTAAPTAAAAPATAARHGESGGCQGHRRAKRLSLLDEIGQGEAAPNAASPRAGAHGASPMESDEQRGRSAHFSSAVEQLRVIGAPTLPAGRRAAAARRLGRHVDILALAVDLGIGIGIAVFIGIVFIGIGTGILVALIALIGQAYRAPSCGMARRSDATAIIGGVGTCRSCRTCRSQRSQPSSMGSIACQSPRCKALVQRHHLRLIGRWSSWCGGRRRSRGGGGGGGRGGGGGGGGGPRAGRRRRSFGGFPGRFVHILRAHGMLVALGELLRRLRYSPHKGGARVLAVLPVVHPGEVDAARVLAP